MTVWQNIRKQLFGSLIFIIGLAPFVGMVALLDHYGVHSYHLVAGNFAIVSIVIMDQIRQIKKSLKQIEGECESLENELYKWRQNWD